MLVENFFKIILFEFLISSIVADNFHDNIKPLNYKINLVPNVQDENNLTFNGKVHTDIEIKANMNNSFVLYSKSLQIKDDIALINSTAEYHSRDFLIDDKDNLLFVRFNDTLTKGNYTLIITYSGFISKNLSESFIYMTYQDKFKEKQWLLLTNIKNNQDAGKIFPCLFRIYSTKITFELSVQHDRAYVALSNTPYNSIITSDENYNNVWTNFEITPPLLTRQLNLIIGNLECSAHYDKAFRVWTLKNVRNYQENLSIIGGKIWKAMKKITGVTDSNKIIKKFDFVMLKGIDIPLIDPYFNYGIIIFTSEIVFYIKYHSNFTLSNQFDQQIAFSICMQWYPFYIFHSNIGNEAFLYYGLITYLVLATTDQTNEAERAMDEFIYQVADSYELNIKLIKILHVVGKANFQSLLHELILESHYRELENNYLVNKYSEVLKVDVLTFEEFLGNQILTPGYPVVTITRNYTANTAVVTQKRFSKTLTENLTEKYWVPLNCVTEDNPNFNDTSINWWFNPNSTEIEIPVAAANTEWIICNKQLIGNYRVNYDEKNWKLILDYLKTSNYSKIHPVNRAQIIDDILTLAEYGYVNHSLVFDLTEYLQQETHRFPLSKFMNNFLHVYNSLLSKASDYYRDFEEHYLFGQSKKLERIFCNGIRKADQTSWDRFFKVYHDYKQVGVLKALGCSPNRVILIKYMAMVLDSNLMESNYFLALMFNSIAEGSFIGVNSILDFLISIQTKKNMSRNEEKFILKGATIVKNFINRYSLLIKFKGVLRNGRVYFGPKRVENYYKTAVENVHFSLNKLL